MINNLAMKFNPRDAMIDSDVDSDAGSTNRFHLQLQGMYGGPASDSETDDFYQAAKKQAFGAKQGYTNDLDDFDDISEHSSDDRDSDSDGQSSPIQK